MKLLNADRLWLAFGHLAVVALAVAAGWLIRSQGQQLPAMDEWELLPQALESDSIWTWYFQHHNEHRYPITKALWFGVLRATGYNFQAPMYLGLVALASAAILSQWTARNLRGRSHPVDALFAVIFLHFGHAFTFMMGYQVGFALFAYGAAGWLWSAVHIQRGGGLGWRIAAVCFAALIVQCGGFGLAFSPFLALGFAQLGLRDLRSRRPISGSFAWLFAASIPIYSIGVYFTMPSYLTGDGLNPFESPATFASALVGYLCSGLGQWPTLNGAPLRIAVGILVAGAFLAAAFAAVRFWIQRPEQRLVATALLGLGLGTLVVGAAAAKARGTGWTERYAAPAAAGWAAVLMVAIAAPPSSKRVRVLASGALLAMGGATVYFNLGDGLRYAYYMRISLTEMQWDLEAGLPAEFLGGRYGGTHGVFVGDLATPLIRRIHRGGVPQFRNLGPDPAYSARPVEGFAEPIVASKEDGERIGPGGTIPGMIFHPPLGAIALRMKVTTVKTAGWHRVTAVWIDPATDVERRANAHPHSTPLSLPLVFPFEGRPESIRMTFASAIQELRFENFEWLMSKQP